VAAFITKYVMRTFLKTISPYFIIKAFRNLRKRQEKRIYRGNEVTCPVCGFTAGSFAPYRPNNRKNARCIHCGSLERHRLQFLYLTEKTDLFTSTTPLRLLHFSPEKSLYDIIARYKHIDYTLCDLSPRSVDFRDIPGMRKADITHMPFPDGCFDVILCNHVLEHIEDDRRAMQELYRVMAPGGWGIFQVPIRWRHETYEDFSITSPRERKKAFNMPDHVRLYGRDYPERLAAAGFMVTPDNYVSTLPEADRIRFGINPREIIFLCKKEPGLE
jgi:SAM-dependent methyltransferase